MTPVRPILADGSTCFDHELSFAFGSIAPRASFVHHPTEITECDADAGGCLVKALVVERGAAPVFGPILSQPPIQTRRAVAGKLRQFRFCLGLIGQRETLQAMWTYIAIAIGGTLGCWARYGQTKFVQAVCGRDFPYATLSINVIGSFVLGLLFIATLERMTLSPALRTGVLTGVLGGYTTFSTFEMEAVLLVEGGEFLKAAAYVFLSVALGFVAAFGGVYIARNL